MLVAPLWCGLGRCSRAAVVIKAAANPRLYYRLNCYYHFLFSLLSLLLLSLLQGDRLFPIAPLHSRRLCGASSRTGSRPSICFDQHLLLLLLLYITCLSSPLSAADVCAVHQAEPAQGPGPLRRPHDRAPAPVQRRRRRGQCYYYYYY